MSAPVITVQPTDQMVSVGQTATYSVTATSDHGALTYQWKKGFEFGSNASIPGATSASYTTPAATSADDGTIYWCFIVNADGTTETNNVILTVAPAFIIQKAAKVNTSGGNSVTVTFPNPLKANSVVLVALAATDSGGVVGANGNGLSHITVTDTLGRNYTAFGSLVKIQGDATNGLTLLTGFVFASTFNQDMPGGSDSVTFTFTPISSAGNCQVGMVAYEMAAVVRGSGDNCYSTAASNNFPVANNLPGLLTWLAQPYGIFMFVVGAAFAGGSPITGGSGWTLDGEGVSGNSVIGVQSMYTAVTDDEFPGQQTSFGSSPASGLSSIGQGILFGLLAPFGTPPGGGSAYDPTLVFLGSVSETADDSEGTQYIGHVKLITSAPAGLNNPYLGKIKKVSSVPAGVNDPALGQVVIVSGPPNGFKGNRSLPGALR